MPIKDNNFQHLTDYELLVVWHSLNQSWFSYNESYVSGTSDEIRQNVTDTGCRSVWLRVDAIVCSRKLNVDTFTKQVTANITRENPNG